jgi:SAM-dependent methyltransferase
MSLITRLQIAVRNVQFKRWRRRNPGATFKDYFVELERESVAGSRVHPTLGENLRDGDFGKVGERQFSHVLKHGLAPGHACVDYGCGTLRVGVHAIRYLNCGCYWGLDVDQSLLDVGRRLIGPELISEKRPHLHTISPGAIEKVAGAKPALLFSVAVLIHVHPDELEEYFQNILTIIGPSGKAIVTGKWSAGKTFQFSAKSWAHSLPLMGDVVDRLNGCLTVSEQKEYPSLGRIARGGTLEVASGRNPASLGELFG